MNGRINIRLIVSVVVAAVVFGLLIWPYVSSPSGPTTGTPTATATQASSTRSPTASASIDPVSKLRWVDLAALPAQAADTMDEIAAGPPYAYPGNDGVVYHNNNGVLPKQADGYYHEFTVVTPGSSTRGARRIIAGGPSRGQTNAEFYYTGDHYDSFVRIRP